MTIFNPAWPGCWPSVRAALFSLPSRVCQGQRAKPGQQGDWGGGVSPGGLGRVRRLCYFGKWQPSKNFVRRGRLAGHKEWIGRNYGINLQLEVSSYCLKAKLRSQSIIFLWLNVLKVVGGSLSLDAIFLKARIDFGLSITTLTTFIFFTFIYFIYFLSQLDIQQLIPRHCLFQNLEFIHKKHSKEETFKNSGKIYSHILC